MMLPRAPRAAGDQTGSVLIEVLVSLLILSIGIAPAFAVFPRSHATAATAQNLQIASQLGTDSIEQLRGTPWTTLKAGALRHSSSFPASAPVTDRVTFTGGLPTAYRPAGKPSEPLVATAASSSSQPLDYEEVSIDGRRFGVYRFASWRKESCPLVSISALLGGVDITTALSTISGLQSKVTTVNSLLSSTTSNLTGRSSALNALIGPAPGTGGSLATLTTTASTALTSVNSVSGSLLSFVTATLNAATQTSIATTLTGNITAVRTTLQAQQTTLATLSGQLIAATSQLSALSTSLSSLSSQLTSLQSAVTTGTASGLISGNLLDLCQLPDDLELGKLPEVKGKLTEAGTTLDALGIDAPNTLSTLGTSLTTLGTSLTTLTNRQTTVSGALSTLKSDIAAAQSKLLGGLLCVVLTIVDPTCSQVKADEQGLSASLTYSGTISVPAALATATSTLDTDTQRFTTAIGTAPTSASSGTGLRGLIAALVAVPPVGNTIRVSAAVVPLNAPSGVGLTKPVWVTGVITNPSAHLL